MEKLRQLFWQVVQKSVDWAVQLALGVWGLTVLLYLWHTTQNVVEFARSPHPVVGWGIAMLGAVLAWGVGDAVKRGVIWYRTRNLRHKYVELLGFRWEISPHFINGGFRTSVEECAPALIREFIKGPLCLHCSAECAKTIQDVSVRAVQPVCPVCGAPCPEGSDMGDAIELNKRVYLYIQSQLRRRASSGNFMKVSS
mgnify:CR=1 FL=1